MNEEMRNLAALAALGAISPADAARLAEAVEAHPELADQLAVDRSTVELLGEVGSRAQLPDLGDRLVAAARADLAATAPAPAQVRRQRWRRFAPTFGVAAVAAAAAVAVTLVVTRDAGLGTPAVEAQLAPGQLAPAGIRGTAALYRPDAPNGHVVLDLDDMPPAPAGHHYEVWVLRSGSANMESVGTFEPASRSHVHLDLNLPGGGPYAALDISVEDDGGPPEHSGKSVAGAKFS